MNGGLRVCGFFQFCFPAALIAHFHGAQDADFVGQWAEVHLPETG
jgi:hypothetical protein